MNDRPITYEYLSEGLDPTNGEIISLIVFVSNFWIGRLCSLVARAST